MSVEIPEERSGADLMTDALAFRSVDRNEELEALDAAGRRLLADYDDTVAALNAARRELDEARSALSTHHVDHPVVRRALTLTCLDCGMPITGSRDGWIHV